MSRESEEIKLLKEKASRIKKEFNQEVDSMLHGLENNKKISTSDIDKEDDELEKENVEEYEKRLEDLKGELKRLKKIKKQQKKISKLEEEKEDVIKKIERKKDWDRKYKGHKKH